MASGGCERGADAHSSPWSFHPDTRAQREHPRMSTPAMLKKTRAIVRRWLRNYRASFNGEDLVRLARIFRTDKWGSHWYAQHYNRHFAPLRKRKLRSEEHTSELQSHSDLVCRLLLETKN